MVPVDLLMAEHRLIERMVKLLNHALAKMQATGQANPKFIDIATDFFRVYTDICHHGKEERILFSELAGKPLLTEHRATMHQLIQEHEFMRRVVKELIDLKERYELGNHETLQGIERGISTLSTLYPKHIEKEEKHFFLPAMDYFSQEERNAMLKAFPQFDAKLIHELYNEKVIELEQAQE